MTTIQIVDGHDKYGISEKSIGPVIKSVQLYFVCFKLTITITSEGFNIGVSFNLNTDPELSPYIEFNELLVLPLPMVPGS